MYFNSVADSFILVLNPAIQADIRDYQHYKSGERIDGMFGAVAMIGGFVTMATSSVLPAVYEKYGIYSGNGYENMYDVLYDLPTLYKLVGVLVILSAVGAALNVVPYFFYDLSETKQKAVIRILQIRAMFEDYGNGVLTDEDMKGTMELIGDAQRRTQSPKPTDLHTLKARKATKAELKQAKADMEEYEIAWAVVNELDRFNTDEAQARLNWARDVLAKGTNGILSFSEDTLVSAKALPKGTKEERALRKAAVADAKLGLRSKKAALRYYPNGIAAFDADGFRRLEEEEKALAERKAALLKAKAGKDEIAEADSRHRDVLRQIEALETEYQHYSESTKAYTEAKKYVTQAENYARFGELAEKYQIIADQ
jgi:hypothetical protein